MMLDTIDLLAAELAAAMCESFRTPVGTPTNAGAFTQTAEKAVTDPEVSTRNHRLIIPSARA
ncbi:hypothetical protein DMI62_22610 [Escherichia coli]|nr:hypothetical protein [Escherichia coli]